MGYFKKTMYTGPNCEDHSDTSPEAVAERKPPKHDYSHLGDWDSDTCLVCEVKAPSGMVWVDGICTGCRAL